MASAWAAMQHAGNARVGVEHRNTRLLQAIRLSVGAPNLATLLQHRRLPTVQPTSWLRAMRALMFSSRSMRTKATGG